MIMNCPQCTNEMVLTKATDFGNEYHYCRTCKKELSELVVLEPVDNSKFFVADHYKGETTIFGIDWSKARNQFSSLPPNVSEIILPLDPGKDLEVNLLKLLANLRFISKTIYLNNINMLDLSLSCSLVLGIGIYFHNILVTEDINLTCLEVKFSPNLPASPPVNLFGQGALSKP